MFSFVFHIHVYSPNGQLSVNHLLMVMAVPEVVLQIPFLFRYMILGHLNTPIKDNECIKIVTEPILRGLESVSFVFEVDESQITLRG